MASRQQFLLTSQLQHLTALDQQIATLDAEVERRLAPLAETQALIESHPGIGKRTAEPVLSEIGATVAPFRTPEALAKWVGLAPGNHESAGKCLSGRTKATYVGAQYRRMARTKGAKRASVIVAHTLVVDLWDMLYRQ